MQNNICSATKTPSQHTKTDKCSMSHNQTLANKFARPEEVYSLKNNGVLDGLGAFAAPDAHSRLEYHAFDQPYGTRVLVLGCEL